MKMNLSALRIPTLAAVVLPFATVSLVGACGGSSSQSPGATPVPTPAQGGTAGGKTKGPGSGDASGDQPKTPRLLRSDVDEALVAPCTKGQAFARGLCWDEVHFKPTGVTLTRPGEAWTFFENGAQVSDFVRSSYVYLRSQSRMSGNFQTLTMFQNVGVARVSNWLASPAGENGELPPPVQGRYTFLPEEMGVATPVNARSLDVGKVNEAEFYLESSVTFVDPDGSRDTREWPLAGTLEVCGKTFSIPTVTQGDFEKTCGNGPYSDGDTARFDIPNGVMALLLGSAPIPSERKPYRVTYQLEFPESR